MFVFFNIKTSTRVQNLILNAKIFFNGIIFMITLITVN